MIKTKNMGIPVIVCCGTNGRAVLYGRTKLEPVAGQPIQLSGARMVLYWDAACGGLLGLAAKGPRGKTRITAAVESHGDELVRQWGRAGDTAAAERDQWAAC